MLIDLDQSKTFERGNYWFLAVVLETARFNPEFCKGIGFLCLSSMALVQMNGKRSRSFAIELSVSQGCTLSPILYVHALESLFRRYSDEKANPVPCGIVPNCWLRATVSTYTDDVTVFLLSCNDIEAMNSGACSVRKGLRGQDKH